MKNALIGLVLFVLVGCASFGGTKDDFFSGKIFASAIDEGCALACSEQVIADEKVCGNVCNTLADIGVEYAENQGLALLNDEQKMVLFEQTFEHAVGTVCGTLCRGQDKAPVEVCDPTCNFLAKTGVDVIKSKLK